MLLDSLYKRSNRYFMWWRISLPKRTTNVLLFLLWKNLSASEENYLFRQNRKNFLLCSSNSILVKHIGDLLFKIHDCNSK